MKPVHFKISPLKEELVSHSGPALAGELLASTEIAKSANSMIREIGGSRPSW